MPASADEKTKGGGEEGTKHNGNNERDLRGRTREVEGEKMGNRGNISIGRRLVGKPSWKRGRSASV